MQHTLQAAMSFDGVGLHSGKPVNMTIHPAPVGHGIVFRRTDIRSGDTRIPATWAHARQTPLCTVIENASGASVSTVEHVMAALAGCGVHNARVDIDSPEAPIMDGSAIPFVDAILRGGVRAQTKPVEVIEVLREIEVRSGQARATLRPSDRLRMSFRIDFPDAAIGVQQKSLDLSNGTFVRELSDARTFCRYSDVTTMHEAGLALGGSLHNALVVDGDKVLSPGGMRSPDEAVRHKMLDALGDLSLAGAPILGHYDGDRAGHALTIGLLKALFAAPNAFRVINCGPALAKRLPGVGALHREIPAVA